MYPSVASTMNTSLIDHSQTSSITTGCPMAGVMKTSKMRGFGRAFPRSRYDDPRGGRASSLERNVLRYRAAEVALYLYFAQEVRNYMLQTVYPNSINLSTIPLPQKSEEKRLNGVLLKLVFDAELSCPIPDDHISPRRSAFFMARSVLRDIRSGVRTC